MTTATVHPCIETTMAEIEAEMRKWENTPGTVHFTYVGELRDGVPRVTVALGGHIKNRPITAKRASICLTDS